MLKYTTGDILTADTCALVNTVNCVGVMGRGIALQFKNKFPDNFQYYSKACKQQAVVLGTMLVYNTGNLFNPKYIINFPTKNHWRNASHVEDIITGLNDLARVIQKLQLKSIAIPPLGCGLGGLEWQLVKSKITQILGKLPNVRIVLFEPQSQLNIITTTKTPKMTHGRASLITLMHNYLAGLLHTSISLLEVHKLMYFMQESGERLKLSYKKHIYGPYAENLRHVLQHIEGHFISGYADGGDTPAKQVKLMATAYTNANEFLQNHPQTKQHLARVTALIAGFETPFGMELLATVHWCATKESTVNLQQLVDNIYQWNDRKHQFSYRQIEQAYNILKSKGWLNCKYKD